MSALKIRTADGTKLPAPRLQLRWEANKGGPAYQWQCHYELVLPLDKYDIRREVYNDDGEEIGEVDELVVALKPPSLRGSSCTPCKAQDGTPYYDPPYRDGAHAGWDAKVLGNPPIYVIAPDGMAFKREEKPEQPANSIRQQGGSAP
jgi:hypothetical protein